MTDEANTAQETATPPQVAPTPANVDDINARIQGNLTQVKNLHPSIAEKFEAEIIAMKESLEDLFHRIKAEL